LNNLSSTPSLRSKISSWLIRNPKFNPYKFSLSFGFRNLTNSIRLLPNFLIIGGSKSGKHTLLAYLNQHPKIETGVNPVTKNVGIYYFSSSYDIHSLGWYRAHFPIKFFKHKMVGEAPGVYLNHPLVPRRVKHVMPNVKLINIFRNPVDRAYSAYNHAVRFGWEISSFEDAINDEITRIKIANESNEINIDNIDFTNFLTFSYLRHGLYAQHLERWFEIFLYKQFHFISTDEINDYEKTLSNIFDFLDVPHIELTQVEKKNIGVGRGKYEPMSKTTRKFLEDFFRPHNEKLFKLIGKRFDWND